MCHWRQGDESSKRQPGTVLSWETSFHLHTNNLLQIWCSLPFRPSLLIIPTSVWKCVNLVSHVRPKCKHGCPKYWHMAIINGSHLIFEALGHLPKYPRGQGQSSGEWEIPLEWEGCFECGTGIHDQTHMQLGLQIYSRRVSETHQQRKDFCTTLKLSQSSSSFCSRMTAPFTYIGDRT